MTIFHQDETIYVKLEYPRHEKKKCIQIDLIDVRASDGIRISYDFDRDGWAIKQPTVLSWESYDKVCDPKYKEMAFIQSWQNFPDDKKIWGGKNDRIQRISK